MSRMIQIRNVPDDVHRRAKARAALEGLSLSDYVLRELRKSLTRPTLAELAERIARQPSPELVPRPADILREERDRR